MTHEDLKLVCDQIKTMKAEIAQLQREIAELKVDADRWRYIRRYREDCTIPLVGAFKGQFTRFTLATADTLVDRAMNGETLQ